jgi:hypothetical protein
VVSAVAIPTIRATLLAILPETLALVS